MVFLFGFKNMEFPFFYSDKQKVKDFSIDLKNKKQSKGRGRTQATAHLKKQKTSA